MFKCSNDDEKEKGRIQLQEPVSLQIQINVVVVVCVIESENVLSTECGACRYKKYDGMLEKRERESRR